MKKVLLQLSIVLSAGIQLTQTAFAQGVGINETGSSPHPSAGLDVDFNNKGFLPPRMTTAERDAIQNPASMLIIANTTTNCLEIYIAPNWQNVFCGCSSAPANLSYTDNGPLIYCSNSGITPNSSSTQASTPSSFTVNPSLPSGLQLNNVNGQITGTPTAITSAANYTITASNACGSTSRVLNIGVIATPATPPAISGLSAPTINTSANYSITAVSGAASYTWAVPAGWTINSGQGSTAINVTAGSNAGDITVTATNSCGTSSASIKAVTSWHPIVATGGTITEYTADGTNGVDGVQYRVHSFTTVGNSSFVVTDAGTDEQVDYLIVAGGGGGARGGGGGGGFIEGEVSVSVTHYPLVVGSGGTGGTATISFHAKGTNGGNSVVFNLTAIGGGAGGGDDNTSSSRIGSDGGSGGGGATHGVNTIWAGGSGTPSQGFAGGTNGGFGGASPFPSGGGGGAAGSGGNAINSTTPGSGGVGKQSSITGSFEYYAGGGQAGLYDSPFTGTGGGLGGGGNGRGNNSPGEAGSANTGGGGGGSGQARNGGSGGSGIVIIRYPLTNPNP